MTVYMYSNTNRCQIGGYHINKPRFVQRQFPIKKCWLGRLTETTRETAPPLWSLVYNDSILFAIDFICSLTKKI